jgi:hypothetical protein
MQTTSTHDCHPHFYCLKLYDILVFQIKGGMTIGTPTTWLLGAYCTRFVAEDYVMERVISYHYRLVPFIV